MKNIFYEAIKFYLIKRGFKTNRKIIVIESDDWGSIRMPNKNVFNTLKNSNAKIANDYYSQLDTIANKEDLEKLFNVLIKFKDSKDNYPVITANTIVANPDFDKIRQNNFKKYEYETFNKTIKKLKDGESILKLWQKGQDEKLFTPQLHGREHLNVPLWLKELQMGNKDLLEAFDQKCFSIPYTKIVKHKRNNMMASLDYAQLPNEIKYQENYIKDGAKIFHDYFGFKSRSFIAPAYIWHPQIENELKNQGVLFLQGLPIQFMPNSNSKFSRKIHYIGQKNTKNQYYLVRNAFFEPSSSNEDWVNLALKKIEDAFKNKKPAIIGAHRVNFIGGLIKENRNKNLKEFELFLQKILSLWPEVEFMSSDQLGNLILESDKKQGRL